MRIYWAVRCNKAKKTENKYWCGSRGRVQYDRAAGFALMAQIVFLCLAVLLRRRSVPQCRVEFRAFCNSGECLHTAVVFFFLKGICNESSGTKILILWKSCTVGKQINKWNASRRQCTTSRFWKAAAAFQDPRYSKLGLGRLCQEPSAAYRSENCDCGLHQTEIDPEENSLSLMPVFELLPPHCAQYTIYRD